jgi:hypothetical protein
MKLPSFLLTFVCLPLLAQEQPAPATPETTPPSAKLPEKPKDLPDFIRYAETETDARLETAIKTYTNPDGVIVDLIGVVHIADASYYKLINEKLTTYDAVLYELVGDPEALKKPDSNAKAAPNPLRGIQKMVGSLLKLSFQLDQIDYTKANFVHADLSAEQFSKLQAAKGENLMTLLARAMKMEKDGKLGIDEKDMNLDMTQILGALSGSGGADSLKIIMAKVFDKAETMVDSFEGPDEKSGTVLLTERNKVVRDKLEESIKGGKKHLSIFFGAGHLPGLEVLIKNLKFKNEKEEWLAAWTMKKGQTAKKQAE